MAYQPIVALADQGVVAHEALLRWHHPQLGWVDPATIVNIATGIGLADKLGEYVLDHACRHAAQALDQPGQVSVNVIAAQLRNPHFPALVRHTLHRNHLAPQQLILEITEQDQLGSDPHSAAALPTLADLGVNIAIDDFGTGYANLINLSTMPIAIVKLAAELCRNVTADTPAGARNAETIKHVAEIAHSLGLTVIAEGIEHQTQADTLHALGCDLGQGFLLGRPAHP